MHTIEARKSLDEDQVATDSLCSFTYALGVALSTQLQFTAINLASTALLALDSAGSYKININ